PGDTVDAADALQVGFRQARHFVEIANLIVHDPDVRIAHVGDLTAGTADDAGEHRDLLGHQKGGEGDTEDDAKILAAITGEHLESDPVQDDTSPSTAGLNPAPNLATAFTRAVSGTRTLLC